MAAKSPRKSGVTTQRYMELLSGHYDPKHEQAIAAQMQQYVQTLTYKAESLQYLKPTVELKNIVCFALALSSSGYHLPTEEGAKRGGVSVKAYQSYKAAAENVLKIGTGINARGVGIRLGIEKAIPTAEKLLTAFKQEYAVTYEGVPDDQFVAAALYIACTKMKIKQAKKELAQISKLKPSGFDALCGQMKQSFDPSWIEKKTDKAVSKKRRKSDDVDIIHDRAEKAKSGKHDVEPCLVEDYEIFRKRIMSEAFEKLKETDKKRYDEYKKLYADPEVPVETAPIPEESIAPPRKRRKVR